MLRARCHDLQECRLHLAGSQRATTEFRADHKMLIFANGMAAIAYLGSNYTMR